MYEPWPLQPLNNRLQFPSIADGMLDNSPTGHQYILLGAGGSLRLDREVYAAILENPSALLSKLNHGTLRLEEEKILCVGDGKRRVGFLGAIGDLAADGSNEDLYTVSTLEQKMQSTKAEAKLTLENSPKSSDGTLSDFVSLHTLS
jgi:hypothetical protein